MQNVRSITCVNSAAFEMEFSVEWDGGKTGLSRRYPVGESATIDLSNHSIPDGAEVWPRIHAIAGHTHSCKAHVVYDPTSEGAATYRIVGTTADIHCKLEG